MSQDSVTPEGAGDTQTPEDENVLAPATPFAGGAAVEPVQETTDPSDDDETVLAPATPFAGGAAVEPTHEA